MARLTYLIVAATLALMILVWQTAQTVESKEDLLAGYVGKYYPCGSYTAKLAHAEAVTIVKDGNALTIKGVKAWDKCRFVLKDRKLCDVKLRIGNLVPGEIRFSDQGQARKVLRADFCYDNFIFVSCDTVH